MSWPIRIISIITICILCGSCKNKNRLDNNYTPVETLPNGSILVADSIIYDVVLRDIDHEDPWESERLKSLKLDVFVDNVFDKLYQRELFAYDFYTGKELTLKDIKAIEDREGFSRTKVSKVQFNERWSIDSLGVLNKKINYMTFGLESYSLQGTFTGHKALFKVYKNPISGR
ncbi:MAG: hypothetical protein AB9846_08835 [Tenuifilaceae bacterium]